jgi:hypothetical protein
VSLLLAGQKVTADAINAALGNTWTAYTPTWTGATANPAIGNGFLAGAYVKIGKTVHVRINLLAGSTTTFGTGAWSFALPETATTVANYSSKFIWTAAAHGLDAGTAYRIGTVGVQSGASVCQIVDTGGSNWQSNVPHTWANTDYVQLEFSYEAAAA